MTTATVVATYTENGATCLEVAVDEGQKDKNNKTSVTVYTGRVPTADLEGLTEKEQKALLVAAVKAVRDEHLSPSAPAPAVSAPKITGSITV